MDNQATNILYSEHEIILSALDVVEQIGSHIGQDDEQYAVRAEKLLQFFREYGDQYHHRKEEEFLFPEMKKKNELLGDGVLAEMLDNHSDFREMLAGIEKLLKDKAYAQAHKAFLKYANSLRDHIAVENDEVFHMAEALFSEEECIRLGHRFDDADRELGLERKVTLAELAESALQD